MDSPRNTRIQSSVHLARCRAGVLVAALAMAWLVVGCGSSDEPAKADQRPAKASPSPAVTAPATPAAATPAPTGAPVVYLLGGSSARESIVSNASWAAQVKQLGGGSVTTKDLGASNEAYGQDILLVKAMPKGPAIVLIGLAVGRYTGPPPEGGYQEAIPDAVAAMSPGALVNHRYKVSHIKTPAEKATMVDEWVAGHYPVFEKDYAANAADLEALVKACKERGFRPVLLQLPLNLEVVGTAFDPALSTYVPAAKQLAAENDIPWIDFVAAARLKGGDFYDLMHLVEPGRTKWQKLLSAKTVKLLKQYGMSQD